VRRGLSVRWWTSSAGDLNLSDTVGVIDGSWQMLADGTKGVMPSWWDLGFLHDIPSHLRCARMRTIEAWHMGEMVTSLSSQTIRSEFMRGVKGDRGLKGTVLYSDSRKEEHSKLRG
jgi:hypothetical protein